MSPLDLHVLSTPPAFVLSQDQTLMFNPLSSFPVSSIKLAKALNLLQQIRRLLSQKSDCSLSLDLLRCIVFKDRFAFVLSLNAGFIITKHPLFVKPFFQISDIFFQLHHIVERIDQDPRNVVS